MGYLYGDLTPFPLETNFVELIRDVTNLCHTLLQVDIAIEGYHGRIESEKQSVAGTLGEFKEVARNMAEALQPHVTGASGPVKEVSTRLIQSVRGVLEQAQRSLVSNRDANAIDAETKIRIERERTIPALERFLLRHDLPNTRWSLQWSASPGDAQRIEARGTAVTPFGLEGVFALEVPPGSPWGRAVKVSEVKAGGALNLPKKARKGTVRHKVELDRYLIMHFARDSKAVRLLLRRALKPGAPGFEIGWQGDELTVTGLDDPSFPPEPARLDEFDGNLAMELIQHVESQLVPLVQRRVRLEQGLLGGIRVDELESPAALARTLIRAVAPYAQEIIRRSPVPGELTLKQVVDDGRREEVFISTTELTRIYADLPPERRACFDDLGLGPPTVALASEMDEALESGEVENEAAAFVEEEEITRNGLRDVKVIVEAFKEAEED